MDKRFFSLISCIIMVTHGFSHGNAQARQFMLKFGLTFGTEFASIEESMPGILEQKIPVGGRSVVKAANFKRLVTADKF